MGPRAQQVLYCMVTLCVGAAGRPVGTAHDVFARFAPTFATRRGGAPLSDASQWVALAAVDSTLEVELRDSEVEEAGGAEPYMAANGRVVGHENSDFMLKGTERTLYGWVTLEDEGRAFEYTTEDGEVQVEEVPLAKVKPPPCGPTADGEVPDTETPATPSPTRAPTPAPVQESCVDVTVNGRPWHSGYGEEYGCAYFGGRAYRCEKWGARREKDGYVANTACCACGGGVHGEAAAPRGKAVELEAHEAEYEGQDLRYLQSLPGAAVVLLLDIDVFFRNKATGDAVRRYNKQHFYENWQITAAGFSMFELNVVTDHAVYRSTPIRNRVLACFLDEEGRSYAYPNTVGSNRCGSFNFRSATGYGLGRTTLHEAGHQFGLRHDGNPGLEYSNGLPAFRYFPIMGNFWPGTRWGQRVLYQWSKGEYSGATNREDDLALIGRYVARRADDITAPRPLAVGAGGVVRAGENAGKITDRSDSDTFSFTVGAGGGRVELTIDRTEHVGGAMLDVEATLLDGAGRVVARSNPQADRRAFIDETVGGGEYAVVVRGGAEGTPRNGFSSYSSLGNYGIAGRITNAGPTPPPTPVPTPVPGAVYLSLRGDDGRSVAARFGVVTDGFAPQPYPAEADLSVTLVGAGCALTWTRFDLEASEGCEFDHLEVRAGDWSARYCGAALPPPLTVDAGSVTITLRSDAEIEGTGFTLEFTCGATPVPVPTTEAPATAAPATLAPPRTPEPTPLPVVPATPAPAAVYVTLSLRDNHSKSVGASGGRISDGWDVYPGDTERWLGVRSEGACVLRFASFDVEYESSCGFDYVEVLSGGELLGRYCGSALPGKVTVPGGDGFVVLFHSDAATEGRGFDIDFACGDATLPPLPPQTPAPTPATTPVPRATPAPRTPRPFTPAPLTLPPRTPVPASQYVTLSVRDDHSKSVDASGGRISDGWDVYPGDTEHWIGVRSEGACVVQFASFDVEYESSCGFDYVEIFAGGELLGRYCGSALPGKVTVPGGDGFVVLFHSDSATEGRGFDIDFACGDATLPPLPPQTALPRTPSPVPPTPLPTATPPRTYPPVPPPVPVTYPTERVACRGSVRVGPGRWAQACGVKRNYKVRVTQVELWVETPGLLSGALCPGPALRFDAGPAYRWWKSIPKNRWMRSSVNVWYNPGEPVWVDVSNNNVLFCAAEVWVRLHLERIE